MAPTLPDGSLSDAELVKRAKAKDPTAFDLLVGRYEKRLIGLCYRHLRQYEEACDLAQEVFVQAFMHLDKFRGASSFSTWLYRIGLNACYNKSRWARAKGRGAVTSLDGLLERYEAGADHAAVMSDPQPSALDGLQQRETQALVQEALGSLEEGYKRRWSWWTWKASATSKPPRSSKCPSTPCAPASPGRANSSSSRSSVSEKG